MGCNGAEAAEEPDRHRGGAMMLRTGLCVVHNEHVFPDDKDGGYCGGFRIGGGMCRVVSAVVVPLDLDGIDLDAASATIAGWLELIEVGLGMGETLAGVDTAAMADAVLRAALGIKDGGGV